MFSLSPRVSELLKDKKEEKEVKYLPKKEKAIIKYHGWMKKRRKRKSCQRKASIFTWLQVCLISCTWISEPSSNWMLCSNKWGTSAKHQSQNVEDGRFGESNMFYFPWSNHSALSFQSLDSFTHSPESKVYNELLCWIILSS